MDPGCPHGELGTKLIQTAPYRMNARQMVGSHCDQQQAVFLPGEAESREGRVAATGKHDYANLARGGGVCADVNAIGVPVHKSSTASSIACQI